MDAELSHCLHGISISKTVRYHFWPGLIPPIINWGTYLLTFVMDEPQPQVMVGLSLVVRGGLLLKETAHTQTVTRCLGYEKDRAIGPSLF